MGGLRQHLAVTPEKITLLVRGGRRVEIGVERRKDVASTYTQHGNLVNILTSILNGKLLSVHKN